MSKFKENMNDTIHGIRVNMLLKEMWDILSVQHIGGAECFTWTEMLICRHFEEVYNIKNENSQLYTLFEDLYLSNPLTPPTIEDVLEACESRGLLEVEDGEV